jgi:hypothetical protein
LVPFPIAILARISGPILVRFSIRSLGRIGVHYKSLASTETLLETADLHRDAAKVRRARPEKSSEAIEDMARKRPVWAVPKCLERMLPRIVGRISVAILFKTCYLLRSKSVLALLLEFLVGRSMWRIHSHR